MRAGGRSWLVVGSKAMMARLLVYVYLVMLGITFILEKPITLAIGP